MTETEAATASAGWSVVVPYYNEEAYLAATLASLGAQSVRPLTLILVDNASNDASPEIARTFAAGVAGEGIDVSLVSEARPGQAFALEAGIARANAPFTAICDADTIYPPDYLARAEAMMRGDGAAAAIAFGVGRPDDFMGRLVRAKGRLASFLMPRQAHGGGYAHAFRTEILKSVGGYSRERWPYCLKDHELIHRVAKRGRLAYDFDHWCLASDRRSDRRRMTWTLAERLLYHLTPYGLKDWFFYEFLRARFEARGLSELRLRERDWEGASGA